MNKNNRISDFTKIDLMFFSILAVLSEAVSQFFLERFSSSFYYSFATAICLIAMLRWGLLGIVVALAGSIPELLFSAMAVWPGVLFYVLAGLYLGIPIACYGKRNRNKIVKQPFYLLLYIFLSHCCLSVGKGLSILWLTGERTGIKDFFGATFLVMVINMILCCILRMRQGLLTDMRYYFISEKGEGDEKGGN